MLILCSIHFLTVRWNNYLVNYISLIYRCGINRNLLLLTFSRAEF